MIFKLLLALQKRQRIAALAKLKESFLIAPSIQQQVLQTILEAHQETKWHQQFQSITVENFRQVVPLTTYDNYEKIINEIAETGNYSLLVSEPIQFFQLTSGTSGKSKRIPRTPSLAKTFGKALQAIDGTRYSYFKGNHLTVGFVNTKPLNLTPSGIPEGTGTSGGLRRLLKSGFLKKIIQSVFVAPVEAFLIEDTLSSYYVHLLFALANPNLEVLSSNFASSILEAFQILEKEHQNLLNTLETKALPSFIILEREIKEIIEKKLKVSEKRLEFLKQEFGQGFENIAPRLWPKLSYIQANATGTMEVYAERLPYYVGKMPIYSAGYGASEGWGGVNLDPFAFPIVPYTVLPQCAFYEFIPLADIEQNNPQTLLLEELTIGEIYEIVLTTIGGFYRYRLGDLVKCLGYDGKTPQIQFLSRHQELLNIAGEKTPMSMVYEALKEQLGEHLIDYAVGINSQDFPAFYQVFVEASIPYPDGLNTLIDLSLQKNMSYADKRSDNRIGECQVTFVKSETFAQLKRLKIAQSSDSQFKMPRLLSAETLLVNFEPKIIDKSEE